MKFSTATEKDADDKDWRESRKAASHGIKIAKATGAEVFALYGISTEYVVKHERLGVGQMNLKNFC